MKKLILVLVATLALFAATRTVVAQQYTHQDSVYFERFRGKTYGDVVSKIWLEVCELNRPMYPDSNLVQPGNIILLPLNRQCIAIADALDYRHDHMWRVAEQFAFDIVAPYLFPAPPRPAKTIAPNIPPQKLEEYSAPWWLVFIMIALLVMAALLIFILVKATNKTLSPQTEQFPSQTDDQPPAPKVDPPFLENPPPLTAPDSVILPAAELALRTTLGDGFQIVGVPERGIIKGEQTIFYKDGTYRTINFVEEPGFRALIRFSDGTERLVVCSMTCFNICFRGKDSKLVGTFTPTNGQPQAIPVLDQVQTTRIAENIKLIQSGKNVTTQSNMIPETPVTAKPETQRDVVHLPITPALKENGKLHLTKIQFSTDKGLNLEGIIPIEIKDLKDLISQVQGKPKSAEAGLP